MALKLNNVLIRVTACTVRRSATAIAYVGWFDEQDSCVREKLYEFDCDQDTSNSIAQAYEHLKTMPEFTGATDC
jgi:hypothetical protein